MAEGSGVSRGAAWISSSELVEGSALREALRGHYLADETALIRELLPLAQCYELGSVRERAQGLIEVLRDQNRHLIGGFDNLLQEFSLSTGEGVTLMCLAEALLRIPDAGTADELIRDKLINADGRSHVGHSDSLFVNASAWALLLGGRLVGYSDDRHGELHSLLQQTLGRLGAPAVRRAARYAMSILGDHFVLGSDIAQALARSADSDNRAYRYSFDMLGEGARTAADAKRYCAQYLAAIVAVGEYANRAGPINGPGVSVKLSALFPRFEEGCRDQVMAALVPRLKTLALRAREFDIGLTVDAEEAARLELTLDVFTAVFEDEELSGWQGMGIAVQAYQKRAPAVIDELLAMARRRQRSLMLRLVKGAYWDTEIKYAQQQGLDDYPVFTRKCNTDVCYLACAKWLLDARQFCYPQFATHNAYTVASILSMAGDTEGYEFQRLHGMGEALYRRLLKDEPQLACRVYAPVGEHADLLAYLVRRLLENGANSSFVNHSIDESYPIEELLRDPVAFVVENGASRHPQIPLPADIYGASRRNAQGLNLDDRAMQRNLQKQLSAALPEYADPVAGQSPVINPANSREIVGVIEFDDRDSMALKLDEADSAFHKWSSTPVEQRAAVLRHMADTLEAHRDELMALCIKEAGKTVADAVAEVREAVDFCRYYAAQAEQLGPRTPLGVVLCISPWNFPLAIFIGQVSAALVSGNTVIAKPAEQTSLIAIRAVQLWWQCGVPESALQWVLSPGEPAGRFFTADPRIKAVMFTGSTATGRWLFERLLQRADAPLPLIAETGGQNAMVVDSSALPEQVVDDVVRSAFLSAGQRCSALRVLFLQEEIADAVIDMLIGAMRELSIGDPALLGTDIGPVIDTNALSRLNAHGRFMEGRGKLLFTCCMERHCSAGYFFAPRLYEIEGLSVLDGEVFGPVLHVIRYRADQLGDVLQQVTDSGFGLTLGVHSRIQHTGDVIASHAPVGNVYINRDMVGAVVGVQPFGGRGLSGSGPKAGGPDYLLRLSCAGTAAWQQGVEEAGESHSDAWPVIRDWLDALHPETLGITEHWSQIRECCSRLDRASAARLASPQTLVGVTGESNRLFYEPRGRVCALYETGDDVAHCVMTVVTALACGNRLMLIVPDEWLSWLVLLATQFDDGRLALQALPDEGALALEQAVDVLVTAPAKQGGVPHRHLHLLSRVADSLLRQCRSLPLLVGEEVDAYYPRHFLWEKTVTINTAAVGGNTSLMVLGE